MTSKYSPLTIPPYLCSPKQHDRRNGKKASVPNTAWDTLWHFSIHTVNVLHLTLARICPQLLTTNSKIVCICKPSNIFLQLQRPYHIPQTGEQPFKLSREPIKILPILYWATCWRCFQIALSHLLHWKTAKSKATPS